MSLGSIPEWLAAIGTVGALFLSLLLPREDRRLRTVAQAARISVWAEWKRSQELHDTAARQYFAYINNASDAPIYVELMKVSSERDDPPRLLVEIGTVPAHESADYGVSEADFPPGGDPPYVELTFLDTNRMRWNLDSRAVLKRLRSDPAV
jgi:hypothetical protein